MHLLFYPVNSGNILFRHNNFIYYIGGLEFTDLNFYRKGSILPFVLLNIVGYYYISGPTPPFPSLVEAIRCLLRAHFRLYWRFGNKIKKSFCLLRIVFFWRMKIYDKKYGGNRRESICLFLLLRFIKRDTHVLVWCFVFFGKDYLQLDNVSLCNYTHNTN